MYQKIPRVHKQKILREANGTERDMSVLWDHGRHRMAQGVCWGAPRGCYGAQKGARTTLRCL